MKKWMFVLLLLFLLLMSACGAENPAATEVTEEYKAEAPDFTVYDGEENPVKLSDFQGKPVVLNFWASWCGPCKQEMPDFEEAYAAYGENIQFMMVNLTDGAKETVETASALIDEKGYTFPVFYDTTEAAAIMYNIRSIPTTFFIDAQGYIAAYGTGSLDLETVEEGISMILPGSEE